MFSQSLSAVGQQLNRAVRQTAVATIVGSGLLMAATASHAVVVYSGPVSIVVPATTGGIYLNVVTGATGTTSAGTAGWDINPWNATGIGFFSPSAMTGGSYVLSAAATAANLAVGAMIDSASTFGTGSSANSTQWALNSSANYFGFRFLNEADSLVHYGWAQLSIGSTLATRSIVGYGYESVAGTGILAGAVGAVPEPTTYAMFGLGIAGLLVARRRKQG